MDKYTIIINILEKYKLKFNHERKKQILNYADPNELEYVLDYLINDLKISPRSIEKCPSVLYRKVSAVKNNYDFLKKNNLYSYTINNCLHILATEETTLKDTYEYVKKHLEKNI